ncbi:uncharacterized protein LOC129602036 [Paramacrobiotus metropolitanus]|uniref:uncharacterized protein LOC129602036 n=1 Tax=Paramacrobiotus metropolitanus TaxID=2943436 RepID=UPI002446307C|nr:uncharacterized protein LOC129602036 [Paramacrobiotus metropolitanus]
MEQRKHVLLISFPALGHYLPMLELAKRIVQYHEVTMTCSKSAVVNLERRSILPPAPINFLSLDDHVTLELDEGVKDVKQIVEIMESTEAFYPTFCRGLPKGCNAPVAAVIADEIMYATFKPLKENRTVKVYSFSAFPISLSIKRALTMETAPTVPDEEYFTKGSFGAGVPESLKAIALKDKEAMNYVNTVISSSFEELEPDAAASLKTIKPHMEIKFIGPILPPANNTPDELIKTWMDGKPDRSVVYFSFGTIAAGSAEQIAEIAKALLSLKRPFIWSLRPVQQALLASEISRNGDSHLILPWVPQKQVLAHRATAVFVSHCGWNSTMEGLSYGVPIVAWPGFSDQPANAALVEKLGAGMVVQGVGRVVPSSEIAAVIEKVAGWNGNTDRCVQMAQEMGDKAMATVAPGGKSSQNFLDLMKEF